MTTVASRKAQDKAEQRKAEERCYKYQREVVQAEIDEITAEIFEDCAKSTYRDGSIKPFEVTLDHVDRRRRILDPKHPYPEIKQRKYRIKPIREYYDKGPFLEVEVWTYVRNWEGHFRCGQDQWTANIGDWHKLQVLRALAKRDPLSTPKTPDGAMHYLVRFAETHADKLSFEEKQALVVLQEHFLDPASKEAE